MVGDRRIDRQAVTPTDTPLSSRASWKVPPGVIRLRENESATSLGSFVSCQLQWTLSYVAHLRPSLRARLPRPDQMVGSLAHLIAAQMLQPGSAPHPDEVRVRVKALLEEFLPKVSAPLLAPGQARNLAEARRVIPEALAALAKLLSCDGDVI